MLIVFPSDPAATEAHAFLTAHDIENQLIPIPEEVDYKNSSELSVYVDHENHDSAKLMRALSAAGIVIMRVFKTYTQ